MNEPSSSHRTDDARGAKLAAIVLLLLPVLYLGSYLALVNPGWHTSVESTWFLDYQPSLTYRFGGTISEHIFWPLEQVDRKVRPKAWEPKLIYLID